MTEQQLAHGIKYLSDFLQSIPDHWLYTAGVVVASSGLLAIIVQYTKHLHLKWTGEEMTNHFIDFVIWVTGTLMALSDFLLTQGTNMATLLPFLGVAVPTLKALAPTIYNVSKALHSWFVNRQDETQQQRLKAVLKASEGLTTQASGTTHTVSASFGSEAAGVDSSKLIQL